MITDSAVNEAPLRVAIIGLGFGLTLFDFCFFFSGPFLVSLASVEGGSLAIVPCHKEVCNRHKVFCKFMFMGISPVLGRVRLAVNHELAATGMEDGAEEFPGESGESVFVGNHNSADTAVKDSFQKGLKPLSIPVKP